MSNWVKAIAILLCLAPATAAAESGCAAPRDLGDGWRIAAPAEQGLDPALLCAIGPRFEAWTQANAHAVLVVRHGVLVYERYFAGEDEAWGWPLGRVAFDAATKHELRSITQSVTSLVVGIAVERGWIKDLDTPVFSYFPEHADLRTPEKDRLTVRHLLTMSAGFAWNENLPYSNPANSERLMTMAKDRVRFILEQPLAAPPGTVYNYSGGATELLSAILLKTSGRSLDAIAKEALFEPLGIAELFWVRYPDGQPVAASGLRLRPRDIAKIGQLVLMRGAWQGKQIVPAAWIADAIAPQINGDGLFFYGYQFWLGRSLVGRREIDWAAGVGYGGQRLFIVPSQDLVVVVTAGLYRQAFQWAVGSTVLNRHVLPAVKP